MFMLELFFFFQFSREIGRYQAARERSVWVCRIVAWPSDFFHVVLLFSPHLLSLSPFFSPRVLFKVVSRTRGHKHIHCRPSFPPAPRYVRFVPSIFVFLSVNRIFLSRKYLIDLSPFFPRRLASNCAHSGKNRNVNATMIRVNVLLAACTVTAGGSFSFLFLFNGNTTLYRKCYSYIWGIYILSGNIAIL